MTLKSVAVKLELSWHGFKELDSISRSADANDAKEASAASDSQAGRDNEEHRMLFVVVSGLGSQVDYVLLEKPAYPIDPCPPHDSVNTRTQFHLFNPALSVVLELSLTLLRKRWMAVVEKIGVWRFGRSLRANITISETSEVARQKLDC